MGLQDENRESFDAALAKANERERKKLESIAEDDNIDITDPDDLRKFTRQELIRIVRRNKGSLGAVPAIRELLDRTDGKAPQSVSMTVKQDNASKISDDQLAALLALLPDPVLIPPMPKKLSED